MKTLHDWEGSLLTAENAAPVIVPSIVENDFYTHRQEGQLTRACYIHNKLFIMDQRMKNVFFYCVTCKYNFKFND